MSWQNNAQAIFLSNGPPMPADRGLCMKSKYAGQSPIVIGRSIRRSVRSTGMSAILASEMIGAVNRAVLQGHQTR